jgi:hypothetical protein
VVKYHFVLIFGKVKRRINFRNDGFNGYVEIVGKWKQQQIFVDNISLPGALIYVPNENILVNWGFENNIFGPCIAEWLIYSVL